MSLSAAEQYLLELMNRARLDPSGEAARFGIDLNESLSPGQISAVAKQVLAPNALLETAAILHTQWMLAEDIFSHTGVGGSNPGQRIDAQGYDAFTWGENIAMAGSTNLIPLDGWIEELNKNLFLSHGHRLNLMTAAFDEVGLGAEVGAFVQDGTTFNMAMLTEDFGSTFKDRFLTGVSYRDRDSSDFYTMGEGRAGVTFTVGTASTQTAAAGGYALAAGSAAVTRVTGTAGALRFAVDVDMSHGNVKLDLESNARFLSSGNIRLVSGVRNAELLGVDNLSATGNAAANILTGNSHRNLLLGRDGNDMLSGLGGNDRLKGGTGRDSLDGGGGSDTLVGERGNDTLTGHNGADTFVFAGSFGVDLVTDFKLGQHDHLSFAHGLWTGIRTAAEVVGQFAHVGVNEVVFDFGAGREVHLAGLTSLTGLDGALLIV